MGVQPLSPSDWNGVESEIRSFSDRCLSRGAPAWFRGHRNSAWSLKATLHRFIERVTEGFKPDLPEDQRIGLLREEYKSIYRKFKAEAWLLMGEQERSAWGVAFAMQHYSIPTRLLDWTESFACAVFFTQLDRKPSEEAAIWMQSGCLIPAH
jgi:hypothetical protein